MFGHILFLLPVGEAKQCGPVYYDVMKRAHQNLHVQLYGESFPDTKDGIPEVLWLIQNK